MSADLVLFEPRKIEDKKSYIQPKIFTVSIRAVLVKGKIIYIEF